MKDSTKVDNMENHRLLQEMNNSNSKDKWYSLRIGIDPMFTKPSLFFKDVDLKHKLFIVIIWLFFLGGFFSTHIYWVYNSSDFFCDLFATAGSSSFSVDLIFFGFMILFWILTDFWRMGFSIYTYVLLFIFSFLVAVAVTGPVYFSMRISRSCKIEAARRRIINRFLSSSTNGEGDEDQLLSQAINDPVAYERLVEQNEITHGNTTTGVNKTRFELANFIPVLLFLGFMAYWWFGPTPFPQPTYCSSPNPSPSPKFFN